MPGPECSATKPCEVERPRLTGRTKVMPELVSPGVGCGHAARGWCLSELDERSWTPGGLYVMLRQEGARASRSAVYLHALSVHHSPVCTRWSRSVHL